MICSLASPPGDSDACLFKNNCLGLILLFVLWIPPNIIFSEGWSNDTKICPPATTSSNTWLLQQPPSSFLYFILVLLQSILYPVAKVILLSHKFVVCVSRSVMSDSMTTWTVACQAPLSMEFSRQAYWNGLPFPSPGDLPDPGIESGSPALQSDSLPLSHHEGHKFVSVILDLKTC